MARDITKLHPDLQKTLQQVKDKCAANGLQISIGECVRTVAEQDALYAIGRTVDVGKSTVTNAKGSTYSSMHQWGIAFDFYRADGKADAGGSKGYYDGDGFFGKVGAIGKSLGLDWGGDWTSPVDKPHLQMREYTITTLKTQYGTPEKFFAIWKIAPPAQEGWIQQNNKWYWYQNGKPITGWRMLDWEGVVNWYYFDEAGAMLTGQYILQWSRGISLFLFRPDGSLVMNASVKGVADADGAIKLTPA